MKYKLLSVITAVVALTYAMSASAQGPQRGMGKGNNMPVFADLDLDGDGAIQSKEFYEARAKRMAERAANGGKMKNAANAPAFEDLDTNGDGGISAEEFAAHQAEHIKERQGKKAS